MSRNLEGVLSPPPTASSSHAGPSSLVQHRPITPKSHRLRTSPVPGEGSTFVPVVKFNQSFTQRNTLQAAKPVYGSIPNELLQQPQVGDVVSLPRRPGGRGTDARTQGWTISITTSSSAPTTDDDLQIDIQHLEPTRQTIPLRLQQPQYPQQSPIQGLIPGSPVFSPNFIPAPIPILAHDRIIITQEDLSRIRIKCLLILICGILFPPLWILMGCGHTLDRMILPSVAATTGRQKRQILEVYRPFRVVATTLSGVVLVGTFVGIIVGALVLGGVIV